MKLFGADTWLKSPNDRDVIARWTVGAERGMGYALKLPDPPDPERFEFLALGDSGDSEAAGPRLSPQDAVARQMAADAALPESPGAARFVVHTGDIVYMTGERRLYDRNFRRPYAPFLTPESTVQNLVFRLPFLPVPGNHDYYDLVAWARWLARLPLLGAGLRAVSQELFAFNMPEGGSGMGRDYMRAFVDAAADTSAEALIYRPAQYTRLPNRYYRFRVGQADFFALDSNTLDAPPVGAESARMHAEVEQRIEELEERADELNRQLRHDEVELEAFRTEQRAQIASDPARLAALMDPLNVVTAALQELQSALHTGALPDSSGEAAVASADMAARHWSEAAADLKAAREPEEAHRALRALTETSDEICAALRALEECLAGLPQGATRTQILAARSALEQAVDRWSEMVSPSPAELCDRLRQRSEEALDVQRELALERRRRRYRPEDYDTAQLRWLDQALAESVRERPQGWRIVYLHHPLHSTIVNHCERPDVQGLRNNLLALLQNRVHLVLSGHSHALEWLRSDLLPHTALFVTGGGGQVSLRRSLLAPRVLPRHRDRYSALRENGVVECAVGGRGPAAADGEDGPIYHYLRVEVTPEALFVRPVGVRRLSIGFRREVPMPVYHAPQLPEDRPPWRSRLMEAVEIRRGQPPRAHWA